MIKIQPKTYQPSNIPRVVVQRPMQKLSDGMIITVNRPITLPRISMHVAALKERGDAEI